MRELNLTYDEVKALYEFIEILRGAEMDENIASAEVKLINYLNMGDE